MIVILALCCQLMVLAEEAEGDLDHEVQGALQIFCPHLKELPEIYTSFWERLHSTSLQLEKDLAADAGTPHYEMRGLCVQLALLRTILHGQAGLPFPQAANSCPTLLGIYFEWASGLAERSEQPRRARALLQLGAPLQLMALSRAMMRPDGSKEFKDTQSAVSTKYAEKLQKLKGNQKKLDWQLGSPQRSQVAVHSLCDASYQGGNLENGSFQVTEQNHRRYAQKWGYNYTMHLRSPLPDQEPQFGKLQVAIGALESDDPPEYFLWLDCDALVTNRSISVDDLLDTYDLRDAEFVVAEEPSGINSGVFLLRLEGLRFFKDVMKSNWRFVWDQTMLLHQMAEESDLFADTMCSRWRKQEAPAVDFQWAPHFRLVPQHAMNLYGEGSALQWGAAAWQRGDFILHLGGGEPLSHREPRLPSRPAGPSRAFKILANQMAMRPDFRGQRLRPSVQLELGDTGPAGSDMTLGHTSGELSPQEG